MAAAWGGIFALAARKRGETSLLLAGVVISHWALDFVTHRPDLPLWPGGPETGLGLWNSVPGTLVVEGAVFAAAVIVYTRFTSARNSTGRWGLWTLLGLCTAIWISGPFSPPPPSVTAVAVVALAMWLFPIWGHWIDRNRTKSQRG
jgi:hypothetical protein